MTAKPVQQPASQTGLVDSLQAEVAVEASPLMLFLIAHARKIALALLLFILAIGAYWLYDSQAEKIAREEAQTLGALLIITDPVTRLERLEAFVPSAPASVKREAWFALARAAGQNNAHAKAYAAWENIRSFDPSLKGTASLGMANALAMQEKHAEALALLSGVVADLKGAEAVNANIRISLLAEAVGDYARAIAACDAILASPEGSSDPRTVNQFGQKKAELEDRLAASKQ